MGGPACWDAAAEQLGGNFLPEKLVWRWKVFPPTARCLPVLCQKICQIHPATEQCFGKIQKGETGFWGETEGSSKWALYGTSSSHLLCVFSNTPTLDTNHCCLNIFQISQELIITVTSVSIIIVGWLHEQLELVRNVCRRPKMEKEFLFPNSPRVALSISRRENICRWPRREIISVDPKFWDIKTAFLKNKKIIFRNYSELVWDPQNIFYTWSGVILAYPQLLIY